MSREGSITSTEGCGLCLGTLRKSTQFPTMGWVPCPRCLSLPVNAELQAFAKEWLGCDFWTRSVVNGAVGGLNHSRSGWWSEQVAADDWGRSDTLNGRQKVVPLYLPAGWSLATQWLAHKYGMDAAAGVIWRPFRLTVPAKVGVRPVPAWSLNHIDPDLADDWHKARRVFVNHPAPETMVAFQAWTHVPALASIPKDAPPRHQSARALVLSLEVTP